MTKNVFGGSQCFVSLSRISGAGVNKIPFFSYRIASRSCTKTTGISSKAVVMMYFEFQAVDKRSSTKPFSKHILKFTTGFNTKMLRAALELISSV